MNMHQIAAFNNAKSQHFYGEGQPLSDFLWGGEVRRERNFVVKLSIKTRVMGLGYSVVKVA